MEDNKKSKEIINKYMLSYSAIDDWIYSHSVNDDYKDLDDDMKNILTMINTIAVFLGYVLVDNKKYKITEIEGDEFYYRDEDGILHAVSTH